MQMITNGGNTEGLFHGAVMQSGGPIPVGDIEHGQKYYDFLVDKTGCKKHKDTLDCLRKVPYATYKKAMDASPNMFSYQVGAYIVLLYCDWSIHRLTQALILAWLPRVDGVFLKELPQISARLGRVANVPMIAGMF
jgi:acetylcholinesterase